MKASVIFKGTSGLNTVDNPRRIKGSDLGVAINIKIDQSGQPQRRSGQELVQSGAFHSISSDGYSCFVVKEGTIYEVGTDNSISTVKTGLTNNRISWCSAAGKFFYTNGIDLGYIKNGVDTEWVKTAYVGPETDKELVGPFAGNHLAFHGGRIFIARDNAIWWSEQHSLGLFHLFGSFVQFNSKIRMMVPVDGGMFVSTERRTHFLTGKNPAQFQPTVVCNFPALEWSLCQQKIEGMEIGLQSPGLVALWNSTEGAIAGTPGGAVINLTKNKIIYPENVSQGFSVLNGYNFIHRSY
jgi:hypothetical protein